MTETILIAIIIAKIKGYKLKPMLKCWPLYPIVILECIYLIFQINIFQGNYEYVVFANVYKRIYLYAYLVPMIKYRIYIGGLIGAGFIFIGTCLNNIAIYSNGGKMPVFPSLSYITGYINPEIFGKLNDVHILGGSATNVKLLTDFIDIGYSILSVGDVCIRGFVFIIIYYTIRIVNSNR